MAQVAIYLATAYQINILNVCSSISQMHLENLDLLAHTWVDPLFTSQDKKSFRRGESLTCPFYDLPDSSSGGRDYGRLIQTQPPNVHDMEPIHILLRGDGIADCPFIYVI